MGRKMPTIQFNAYHPDAGDALTCDSVTAFIEA
jgi:hypothetical protein